MRYDGEGRRVKHVVYGMNNVYVYDAFGRLAAEYRNGSWFKDFIYLADRLFVMESTAQATSYVTVDPLGSTRLVTGPSRNVISRHDYLPFGKELQAGIGGRTTTLKYGADDRVLQRFTGQEVDPETGLDHFFFRYYSGRQGRFSTPDPLLATDPTNPQSWNGYAYVYNNPLSLIDPLGLDWTCTVGPDGSIRCTTTQTSGGEGEGGTPPPVIVCPIGQGAACEFLLEALRRAREARSPFGPPPHPSGGATGGTPSGTPSIFQGARLPGETVPACVARAQQALLGEYGGAALRATSLVSLGTFIVTAPTAFRTSVPVPRELFKSAGHFGRAVFQGSFLEAAAFEAVTVQGSLPAAAVGVAQKVAPVAFKAAVWITAVSSAIEGGFWLACR